ncbi:hypothetical protein D3C87_573960 [compost metagenome]
MFEYTREDIKNVELLIDSHAKKLITEAGIGLNEEVINLISEEVDELSSTDLDSCISSPNQCIHFAEIIANNVISSLN